jgi:superfamily II DNA or RNA helicase
MYDENTIIATDKLYIPASQVSERRVLKHYVKSFFAERACAKCDYKPERHCDACTNCDAYKGTFKLANRVIRNNVEYFGLPIGDRANMERKLKIDFDNFEFVDKRTKNKFDYPIRMLTPEQLKKKGIDFDWKDIQEKTIKAMVKKKHGIFVLPPRSGKSLTLIRIGIELGYKMLITADQYDFLKQFIGDIEKFTNLPALQRKTGKKLYGFVKKPSDLDDIQIGIITYQSLINDGLGAKMKRAVNQTFGTLAIDEVHSAAAPCFVKLINSLRMRVKIGCTGTIKRKDGKHVLLFDVVGPVQSDIKADQLVARLMVHPTGVKTKRKFSGRAGFTYMCKFLAEHEKRNQLILEWVLNDLEKGHSIVIPCLFVEHVKHLVKLINNAVGYEIAAPFLGGGTKKNKEYRDWVKHQASNKKIRVVVGIRRLLQRGINIEPWSALYYVMPSNNKPNWKQESSRILTPDPTKRQPIIRFFVDDGVNLALGCFANSWEYSLGFKHIPTPAATERMRALLKNYKVSTYSDDPDPDEEPVRTIPKETRGIGLFARLGRKR